MYTSIPVEATTGRHSRVSSGAAAKCESRKRKQEDYEPNTNNAANDGNENHRPSRNPNTWTATTEAEEEDSTKATIAPPQTDNDKINWIVTNQLWSDNSAQVAEGMNSLFQMLDRHGSPNNFDDNRKTAFRRGGHLAIVQAMIRSNASSSSSYEIQRDGCLSLMKISLCGLDGARQDIVEIGGVKCCRRALEHFSDHASMQTAACKLIRNLWITPDVRRSVVQGGGLTIVLNAMDKLKHNTEVQKCGCKALFALLCDGSTWAKAAVDAGCIEVVVAAMESGQHDADLQIYGCKFLFVLAEIDKNNYCNRIIQAKGLVAIVEAKRTHKDDQRVMCEVRNAVRAIGI